MATLSRDTNLRTFQCKSTDGVDARDNETLRAGAKDSIGGETNSTDVSYDSVSVKKMSPFGALNTNK